MLQAFPNINIDVACFWQNLLDVAFHNSDVKVKRDQGFNCGALTVPFEGQEKLECIKERLEN